MICNTDLLDAVALRIAEEAVPDEVDLAPIMVQAFIQGGKEREELFQREQGSVIGGFGPGGIITILPWILKALAENGPTIYKFLTTDVADLIGLLNGATDLKDKLNKQKNIESLPDNPYQPLKVVIHTISAELKASGLDQDRCDLITYRVVRALIENPQESTVFIQVLERGEL